MSWYESPGAGDGRPDVLGGDTHVFVRIPRGSFRLSEAGTKRVHCKAIPLLTRSKRGRPMYGLLNAVLYSKSCSMKHCERQVPEEAMGDRVGRGYGGLVNGIQYSRYSLLENEIFIRMVSSNLCSRMQQHLPP